MKALSIRQPWAWLIVNGPKDIENRRWYTSFRGPVLIHASTHFDLTSYQALVDLGERMPPRSSFSLGGIIGCARVIDCVREHPSRWFEGPWGFVLAERKPLDFIGLRGQLGFFEVPESMLVGIFE